ncbi:MAG: hypothetical protein RLZ71_972 [Actinomycetota bacterium]|jgi:rhodanese-related sulfurtransferase
MTKVFKLFTALLIALGLSVSLSACAQQVDASKATAIIDVRTATEFASGHLEGAVNMDVQSSEFASEIATLDPSGVYLVYCHSGRRAGLAIDQMKAAGFKNLTNLGGYVDASNATGLPLVQ